MKKLVFIAFCLLAIAGFSQEIEQNWKVSSITKASNSQPIEVNDLAVFSFSEGRFQYALSEEEGDASGNYIRQNNLLIFKFNQPTDTVRYFNIISFDENRLILSENDIVYTLSSSELTTSTTVNASETEQQGEKSSSAKDIIASEGFSVKSLWRGVLGMFSLTDYRILI